MITLESSQYGKPFTRTKKFSVQSSFRLELPPPLIIEASTIKLDETIGQGMCTHHNSVESLGEGRG